VVGINGVTVLKTSDLMQKQKFLDAIIKIFLVFGLSQRMFLIKKVPLTKKG